MALQRARRAIGVVARVGPSRGTVRVKKNTAVHQIVNISGASCPSPVYARISRGYRLSVGSYMYRSGGMTPDEELADLQKKYRAQ